MNTEEYVRCSEDKNELSTVAKYNKELLEKYPWLTPYNVRTGEPLEDYDYEYTWADDISLGWRIVNFLAYHFENVETTRKSVQGLRPLRFVLFLWILGLLDRK